MSWPKRLSFVRRLMGDDAGDAMERERALLRAATATPGLPAGLRGYAARAGEERDGFVEVGSFTEAPGTRFLLPDRTPPVHSLLLGPTGTGKTRVLVGLLRARIARFAAGEDGDRLLIIDPKGELAGLIADAILSLLPTLSARQAERLLSSFVVIDPFSTQALVPMNLLRSDDDADVEAVAWDLAGMLAQLPGSPFGYNQEAYTFNLATVGAELARTPAGCTTLDLAYFLDAPDELRAVAARSPNPAVRSFFAAERLAASSLHGVRARLHRLLRLPGARRMLGARDCVSFPDLLRNRIAVVNAGNAPVGSRDIRDSMLGAIMSRVVRAIFSRTGREPSVTVAIDEFHEVVGIARWVAEDFERILGVSRSRSAHLALVSQSLDAARAVSTALPHIALTNTDWRFVFRAEPDDARAAAFLLPMTGRRRRPQPPPWEDGGRDPFLSPSEERSALVEKLSRLAPREFLFADRRNGGVGAFVRAADVHVERPRLLRGDVARRIATGALALPEAPEERAPAAPLIFRPSGASPEQPARRETERAPALPPEHVPDLPRRRRRL